MEEVLTQQKQLMKDVNLDKLDQMKDQMMEMKF